MLCDTMRVGHCGPTCYADAQRRSTCRGPNSSSARPATWRIREGQREGEVGRFPLATPPRRSPRKKWKIDLNYPITKCTEFPLFTVISKNTCFFLLDS